MSKSKKVAAKKPAKRVAPKNTEDEMKTSAEDEENLDLANDSDDEEDDDEGDDEAEASSANGAENTDKPKRKRTGPRVKPGKRQVIYECVSGEMLELLEDDSKSKIEAIRKRGKSTGDLAVISETVEVTMPPEGQEFDPKKAREEAILKFHEKWGVNPEIVKGPYLHRRTGTTTLLKHKKDRIDVRIADNAAFTTERAMAVHIVKGIPWRAMINFTDNPEVVFAFYKGAEDPEALKKLQTDNPDLKIHKPANGFVYLECFKNINKVQASSPAEQGASN